MPNKTVYSIFARSRPESFREAEVFCLENGKHLDSYAERSEVFFGKSVKE